MQNSQTAHTDLQCKTTKQHIQIYNVKQCTNITTKSLKLPKSNQKPKIEEGQIKQNKHAQLIMCNNKTAKRKTIL